MPKELKKLLDEINSKKQEIRNLVNEDKITEAKAAKEELIKLNDKFNVLYDLYEEEEENKKDAIKDKAKENKILTDSKKEADAFVNAIRARLTEKSISDEDKKIINQMSEGVPADGGLVVPQDIRTAIKELRRGEDSLEELVNVEPVTTLSGSRVIEVNAEEAPFDNIEEGADFPDVQTPQFKQVEYKVKKKGGTLKVTRELIQDSDQNIQAYLKRWIAKKAKVTRNFLILKKADEITKGKEVPVSTLDELKDIFNVKLDPSIAAMAVVVTNQDGFNYLDKLKDSDGKYVLQQDPTQAYQMEGSAMFDEMINNIKIDTVRYLFHVKVEAEKPQRERVAKETGASHGGDSQEVKKKPVKKEPKVGRNDLCPCGSGKKYKSCCGREVV